MNPEESDRFRVEVDTLAPARWNEIVGLFDDGCMHQTHAFAATLWGGERVSHLLLFEEQEIVAAAQVVSVRVPGLGAGIAHCKFGPMWRRGGEVRPEVYRAILRAMRQEYAVRRGLLLRIKPWEVGDAVAVNAGIREAVGLRRQSRTPSYNTFVLDLTASIEELRAGLKPKWRYNLKKAEARDIEIGFSSGVSGMEAFMSVYGRMRDIKSFVDTSEATLLPEMVERLPDELRPTVFTARIDGRPVAAIVNSHLGDVGYYLAGATAAEGRASGASYVLFWEAIRWLKSRDCKWFDLVGSRPSGTGGGAGYRSFKEGLTGKNGAEVFMQDWEVCEALLSRTVVQGATWLRWNSRRARHALNAARERGRRLLGSARD